MKRCPECGYLTDDDASFCPHCGRTLPDTPGILINPGTVPPQNMPRKQIRFNSKAFLAIAAVAVILAAAINVTDIWKKDDRFSDKTETYTWSVPSINAEVAPIAFSVTFTVYGDEMDRAASSGIDRNGSSTMLSNHSENRYAVSEYVVCGQTVKELSQKLWDEYKLKMDSHPLLNDARYFSDYVLAFVQKSATYAYDSDQFGAEEYWLYPVETLYRAKGDCEDTSILASAIYNTLATTAGAQDFIKGGCVFLLPMHAMAGVWMSAAPSASATEKFFFYSGDGHQYYFCETTASNPETHIYSNPRSDDPQYWYYAGAISDRMLGSGATFFTGTANEYV